MNRRAVLAAVAGGSVSIGGCLTDAPRDDGGTDGSPESGGGTAGGGDDERRPDEQSARSLPESPASGDCGVAAEPTSARLTDAVGDPEYCFDGATPDLVVANERDRPVSATVSVSTVEEDFDLDADERVVERSAFEAAPDLAATVTVDGEEYTWTWDERSCYRHAIAIVDDGVEFGRIEPLEGPGDTQHDCYPGRPTEIRLGAEGSPRTVTVTIDDRCTGTRTTETVDVDGGARLGDALVNGGNYDVAVDVHDGGSAVYEYREMCWGLIASIDEDGAVHIYERGID